jgi:hypothetical protein
MDTLACILVEWPVLKKAPRKIKEKIFLGAGI